MLTLGRYFILNKSSIKTHLAPLAVAANVTQEANTHCDHVLFIFAKMFKTYTGFLINEGNSTFVHSVSVILDSIETWWAKADQNLFITCLFLKPFICSKLFNANTISLLVMLGMICCLYIWVLKMDGDPLATLTLQVMKFSSYQRQFSEEMWSVDIVHKASMDEVGAL